MTEKASGAMTAQEFWPIWVKENGLPDDYTISKTLMRKVADALSARNTEELENKLAISLVYAETAWDQVEKLRAALRKYGSHTTQCHGWVDTKTECNCGFDKAKGTAEPSEAELARLRDQGAQSWMQEVALIIARGDYDMDHIGSVEDEAKVIAELIRKHAPVEGAGQWEAGRDAAADYVAGCKDIRAAASLAVFIRSLKAPGGLASPPEGMK